MTPTPSPTHTSAPTPSPASTLPVSNGGGGVHGRAASGWRSIKAWQMLVVVALLSLFADLASKNLAFHYVMSQPITIDREQVLIKAAQDPRLINTLIPDHPPMVVLPKLLHFTLVLNPGAVFGIGPGKRWFFIAFTVVALAFGMMMFARWTTTRDRWAHAAIGLLIGGGLGNLYDRLTYACVRDFIHPLPGWNWPFSLNLLVFKIQQGAPVWPYVSNVADLLLLIGIGMLLVHLWRKDRAPRPHAV